MVRIKNPLAPTYSAYLTPKVVFKPEGLFIFNLNYLKLYKMQEYQLFTTARKIISFIIFILKTSLKYNAPNKAMAS